MRLFEHFHVEAEYDRGKEKHPAMLYLGGSLPTTQPCSRTRAANPVSVISLHTMLSIVTELVEGGELFERIVNKEYYNEKEARFLVRRSPFYGSCPAFELKINPVVR